jgi:hypothetical protein
VGYDEVNEQVDYLCVKFVENCADSSNMTVDEVRDLLRSLFSRFDNPPLLYFSIGAGWLQIVSELNKKLLFIDTTYTIFQIKEKFGGLRFYASFGNISPIAENISRDLIDVAERSSMFTCEICGRFGNRSELKHWMSARCTNHRNVLFNF